MVLIKVYDGPKKLHEIKLGSDPVSLGRDSRCDVSLADPSVSRSHACIEPRGKLHVIRDNGSTNGTFVNDMLVRTQVLTQGDTIRVGKYLIRVTTRESIGSDSTRVRIEKLRDRQQAFSELEHRPAGPLIATADKVFSQFWKLQSEIGYIDQPVTLLNRGLEVVLAELAAHRGSVLLRQPGHAGNTCTPDDLGPAVVLDHNKLKTPAGAETGPEPELVIPGELLQEVCRRGEAADHYVPPNSLASVTGRSCLAAPLREGSEVKGVIYIERVVSERPFSERELQLLSAFADQIAVSLANAQLFAEVQTAKAKLRGILANLTDGILITDASFKIIDANFVAPVLLQVKNKNLLGRSLLDLIRVHRHHPSVDELHHPRLRYGRVIHIYPSIPERRDVTERFVECKLTPFPQNEEVPEGFVATLRDNSEARRIENLKAQFVDNVAHKLRTPLTVLQANLPLLSTGDLNESARQDVVEELQRNTRGLCNLVERFAQFTELEAGVQEGFTPAQCVSPRELVNDAILAAHDQAENTGVTIENRIPPDMPKVQVRTDVMVQAFFQIIHNAVKFTGNGGRIVVNGREADGSVLIEFGDDGPGIPTDEAGAVFEVGHQVDTERTGQVPGAGLGLSIARHVILEHGGDIQVISPYGSADRGTCVSVELLAREDTAPRSSGTEVLCDTKVAT